MIRIHQGHRIETTVQVITLKKILSYIDYQFALVQPSPPSATFPVLHFIIICC
jgi:hypothetical protein